MTSTEENPPLEVAGKVQWQNLPFWGKLVGGSVAAFLMAVLPVWTHWKAEHAAQEAQAAEARARVAAAVTKEDKAEAEGGWKVLKPRLEALEAFKHAQEVKEARAQARAQRRPAAVVPPAPKPLPPTLKAAKEQVQRGPAIIALPDGGSP